MPLALCSDLSAGVLQAILSFSCILCEAILDNLEGNNVLHRVRDVQTIGPEVLITCMGAGGVLEIPGLVRVLRHVTGINRQYK